MTAKMIRLFSRALKTAGLVGALSLTILALTACGSSAEPTDAAPPATDGPTDAPAPTVASAAQASESARTATDETEPQGNLAHKFELTNARGETVSLASYAGDKNVVLVFYRGFW